MFLLTFGYEVGNSYTALSMTGLSACHPERSEGSVALGREMLRGVYPECNEWAQHDSAVTYSDAWINVFHCMIAPYTTITLAHLHLFHTSA